MLQVSISRRAVIGAMTLGLVGVGAVTRLADRAPQPPSPDDRLIDAAVAQKRALLASLGDRDESTVTLIREQELAHIAALLDLRSTVAADTFVAPSPAAAAVTHGLAAMSGERMSQALAAQQPELSRILVLIAASEAVHAVMRG